MDSIVAVKKESNVPPSAGSLAERLKQKVTKLDEEQQRLLTGISVRIKSVLNLGLGLVMSKDLS